MMRAPPLGQVAHDIGNLFGSPDGDDQRRVGGFQHSVPRADVLRDLAAVGDELHVQPAGLVGGDPVRETDDPPAMHEEVVGGQLLKFAETMRADHDGRARVPQLLEELTQLDNPDRIEAVARLIQQQESRMVHDGGGQSQTLLHALGEVGCRAVHELLHLQLLHRLVHLAYDGVPGQSQQRPMVPQNRPGGVQAGEHGVFRHVPQAAARRDGPGRMAADGDATLIGKDQSRDQVQQG